MSARGARARTLLAALAAQVAVAGGARVLHAQAGVPAGGALRAASAGDVDSLLGRALDAEGANRAAEAAAHFRRAFLAAPPGAEARQSALLGLERVWAELGRTDSLLPLVEVALRLRPDDPLVRGVQLRALGMLRRDDEARAAYDAWRVAAAGDIAPYREYARLLIQGGRVRAADTVLMQAAGARGRLGARARELALERAQLRAAAGAWAESGVAWREALAALPATEQAAVFALQGAPDSARGPVVAALLAPPAELPARRAASTLLLVWRRPAEAWRALAELAPDDSVLGAWRDAAEQLERAEAWPSAREAWTRVADVARDADAARSAAAAALAAGDATGALTLLDRADAAGPAGDVARGALLRVRVLSAAGRGAEAERLAASVAPSLDAGDRARLADAVAQGWIASGDLARARSALRALGGAAADSGQAAGWLALYGGDLRGARALLRRPSAGGASGSGDAALTALALLGRTRAEQAPAVGAAFLALARGDTAAATAGLTDAAQTLPEAAPLLRVTAARLHLARREEERAMILWQRVVEESPAAPEAPEAALAWSRALRRRGDAAGARARLEHLIVTWPESALVPIARRELEASS